MCTISEISEHVLIPQATDSRSSETLLHFRHHLTSSGLVPLGDIYQLGTSSRSCYKPNIANFKAVMGDLKRIREVLEQNADLRWGFVIYRCTYDDDEKWARIMEFLNTRVRLNLQDEGGENLFERIDWAVQEDRESLDGAGPVAVREKFATWVQNSGESDDWLGTPRFRACAMASQDELDSILNGPQAEEFDAQGEGFLTLVSLDKEEGDQLVGLSYLVPRIYALLGGPGWENFAVEDDVAIP